MTDEIKRLRAQVATLENRLAHAKQGNAARGALRAAGVPDDWIDDLLDGVFVPERAEDGTWSHAGMEKSTLEKLAVRFVQARPYLKPPEHGAAAQGESAEPTDNRPRYADGSLVPGDKLSVGELADMMKPLPKREKQTRKVKPLKPGELDNLTLDELAVLADEM